MRHRFSRTTRTTTMTTTTKTFTIVRYAILNFLFTYNGDGSTSPCSAFMVAPRRMTRVRQNADQYYYFQFRGYNDDGMERFVAGNMMLSTPRRMSGLAATATSALDMANNNEEEGGVDSGAGDSGSVMEAAMENTIEGGNTISELGFAQASSTLKESFKEGLKQKKDFVRNALKKIASLSLRDYEWRSSIFKQREADRLLEESVARMMGDEPSYVRPMDATEEKIGPLGKAEKSIVNWLASVIEEEGIRAKRIADLNGELVRPIDTPDGGPLADLERRFIEFVDSVVDSEYERWFTGTIRPKDLDVTKRGPLGNFEDKAVRDLESLVESEWTRLEQSKLRGEAVRPIDVPGPLGEMERRVVEVVDAEKMRAKEREGSEDGKMIRPMNSVVKGPLGNAERQVVEELGRIKEEEVERLRNIGRFLAEKRPMEVDRVSALGITEAFLVGLFRAPRLFMKVVDRVKELMESNELDADDQDVLRSKSMNVTSFATSSKSSDEDQE